MAAEIPNSVETKVLIRELVHSSICPSVAFVWLKSMSNLSFYARFIKTKALQPLVFSDVFFSIDCKKKLKIELDNPKLNLLINPCNIAMFRRGPVGVINRRTLL